jgi:hypothetical protein
VFLLPAIILLQKLLYSLYDVLVEVMTLFENMFVHLIAIFQYERLSLFGIDVPKEGFTLFALNAYCF